MKYFALTCLGNIVSLGECKDFDEADNKAEEEGHDANWVGNEEAFERWEKQIAGVKKEWLDERQISEQTEFLNDLVDMHEAQSALEEALGVDSEEAKASMVEWFKELTKAFSS